MLKTNMITFDKDTMDSTGSFLVGELERLDQTLHEPLFDVTWSRDIDLREDVSIADEVSSFSLSTFAAAGAPNPQGINWIGKNSNAIPGIALDIAKLSEPLIPWGMEIGYTILELLSAQQLGRPVDAQKHAGMNIKYQMDIDQMVYVGDPTISKFGLLNSPRVNVASVAPGITGYTQWGIGLKIHDEILEDVNSLLFAAWKQSGYAVCPSKLLLPPEKFAHLLSQKVSEAGNISILQFLEDNSIALKKNGKKLDIQPVKWLEGLGTPMGSPLIATDRMVAYSQDVNRVRFPLVPIQRTPLEYRSLSHLCTYYGRLGVVEFVYPATLYYADGI